LFEQISTILTLHKRSMDCLAGHRRWNFPRWRPGAATAQYALMGVVLIGQLELASAATAMRHRCRASRQHLQVTAAAAAAATWSQHLEAALGSRRRWLV
jgi:hypothetical protein